MSDLTEFLLARIAEDERDARSGRGPEWHVMDHTEPKWASFAVRDEVCDLLAQPYADHPDYRQEWTPNGS